jgi:hypothetical protein
MSTVSRFTAADDLLHDIAGIPDGRESLFYVVPLPDEGLAVMAYAWRHADSGKWGRIVAVGGPDPHSPHVFRIVDGVDLEGEDLDDFTVDGLHVRQPDPLASAEVRYADDDVSIDLRLDALHAPFSWHENADGCPAWAASDRYEQSVRVTGTVTVDGREIAVDGFGHRDHSWGTRDWRALQHWKWMNATTRDGTVSLHAWESLAYAERHVMGYVNRGGTVVPIAAIRATAQLDDRLVHQAVSVEITTDDGATTTLEATLAAGVVIPVATLHLHEMAMTATIDGEPAVAHVEFGWLQAYVAQFTT